jgi:hypothetical protein
MPQAYDIITCLYEQLCLLRLTSSLLLCLLGHSQEQVLLSASSTEITERRVVVLQQLVRCVVFQHIAVVKHQYLVKPDYGL